MDAGAWKQFLPLVLSYRKLRAQTNAMKAQMATLKAEIYALVEANGKWTDDEGYARLVTRKPSVAYDAKALEALFQSVEEARTLLEPHRQEKDGYTYVQIK